MSWGLPNLSVITPTSRFFFVHDWKLFIFRKPLGGLLCELTAVSFGGATNGDHNREYQKCHTNEIRNERKVSRTAGENL